MVAAGIVMKRSSFRASACWVAVSLLLLTAALGAHRALDSTSLGHFARGYMEYSRGNRLESIKYLSEAIELDGSYTLAYFNRGGLYLAEDRYSAAIADFTKVLDLDNRYVMAYYYRGLAHKLAGNGDAARDDLEKYIMASNDKSLAGTAMEQLAELRPPDFSFGLIPAQTIGPRN